MNNLTNQQKGSLMAFIGVMFITPDSLLIRLSSGAEFIVVVCGSIMTMPGLPRVPAADKIKLNKKGDIEGLF